MNDLIKRIHSNFCLAHDLKESEEFYKRLGFDVEVKGDTAKVKLGDFMLAFMDENKTEIQNESGKKPKGLGIYTYIEVENVDEYYQFIKSNGIDPRTEPKTWPWGKREFVVKDPDGYKLVFYSPAK